MDGLLTLGADQDHFIAGFDVGHSRNIHNHLIHRDPPNHLASPSSDQYSSPFDCRPGIAITIARRNRC
jgi:hypothetical protein